MKRRILSILLLAALVIGLLPQGMLPVSAYSETDIAYPAEGGNLYFDKATGTITDCDDSVTGANIPAEIDGVAVTGIGDSAFWCCYNLGCVSIPDSVTSIGGDAFAECYKLAYVNLPDSVERIGSGAFEHTAIYDSAAALPEDGYYYEGVFGPDYWVNGALYIDHWLIAADYIGGSPFPEYDGAWSNGNYTIRQGTVGIAEGAFSNCSSSLTSVTIPDSMTEISEGAFWSCGSLTSATIPDSVTKIGDNAFCGCTALKNVTIPGSVTSIGCNAFDGCTGLTSVTISEGVASIGCNAFEYCSSLKSVTIPGSVTSIGCNAFGYCTGLTSVTISEGVASIGDGAFYDCSRLTGVTIPGSVTSVGEQAFYSCAGLTSVTISEGVASIGGGAFRNCSRLTSVSIPGSVTSVGEQAFYSCTGLTSVTISEGVTSVGCNAFEGCTGLTSMTIPESVTSIGDYAWYSCANLQSVYFMGDAPEIGEGVFRIANIWYDEPVIEIEDINIRGLTLYYIGGKCGWSTPTWNGYPTELWYGEDVPEPPMINEDMYPVMGGNIYFDSANGVIYAGDDSITYADIPAEINGVAVIGIGDGAFAGCTDLTSVTLPESVTSIANSAFEGCTGLTSMTLPEGVTSIGNYAFSGCTGLTSVTLPEGVTSIGNYAFSGCTGLTSVTIPESVTSIGDYAFYNCSSLTSVTIPTDAASMESRMRSLRSSRRSVTLPESVTRIGDGAFKNCSSLTSVVLPNSVTCIGNRTFSGCSALTSVIIPESVTSIGDGAFENCSSLRHVHFLSGMPTLGSSVFDQCSDALTLCILEDAQGWENCAYATELWDYTRTTDCVSFFYTCNTCGEVYSYASEDAHMWVAEEDSRIPPTCTERGEVTYICTACGTSKTEEIAAAGHTEAVDLAIPATCTATGLTEGSHCGVCGVTIVAQEVVATIDHSYTYSDNGDGTHTVGCENCGYSAIEDHAFVDGTCICGAAEVVVPTEDSELKFVTTAFSMGAELKFVFIMTSDTAEKYPTTYVDVVVNGAEGETTVRYNLEDMVQFDSVYRVEFAGIAAKNMGDSFTATIHAEAADGTQYVGVSMTASIAEQIKATLRKSTATETAKTLAVDMLNYGAAAQVYFGYDTEHLVNGDLTAEELAYGTQEVPTIANTMSKTGTGTITVVTPSVTLRSKVTLNMLFNTANYTGDVSKLTYKVTDAATGEVVFTGTPVQQSGTIYKCVYDDVGAKRMRSEVTIGIYDENDVLVSQVQTWSVESYIADILGRSATSDTARALLENMIKYGDAAAAYLG
ncbi:MAG: leucine-rich repeat domain-containing protein [Faecousia sp.]